MRHRFLYIIIILTLSSATFAFAFKSPQDRKSQYWHTIYGQKVAHNPNLDFHTGYSVERIYRPLIKKNIFFDVARALTHNFKDRRRKNMSTATELAAEAFSYLEENKELFNLKENIFALAEDSIVTTNDFQSLNLIPYRLGILIEAAVVSFHFKNGEIFQVVDASYSQIPSPPYSAAPEDDTVAIENIKSELGVNSLNFSRRLYRLPLMLGSHANSLIPVLEFETDIDMIPHKVQIDSRDMSIYQVVSMHNDISSGMIDAKIYPRYYRDPAQYFALKDLQMEAGIFTDSLGRFTVNKAPASPIAMTGRRVRVRDKNNSPLSFAMSQNSDDTWNISYDTIGSDKGNDPQTAQVMAYYHANEIHTFAQTILPNLRWLKTTINVNANLKTGSFGGCNAYWDGTSLNFYMASRSCANTALISDVIYHEWGHGLDQNTGGIQDSAFSEGFGDIMAMIMTRSAKLGLGFYLNSSAPLRELETDKIYPKDRASDPHKEGLIIASTFWDLYRDLVARYGEEPGHQKIAEFALLMISSAVKYTDVYNVLLAIDDDDGNLLNGTPNLCLINANFSKHGLAKAHPSC